MQITITTDSTTVTHELSEEEIQVMIQADQRLRQQVDPQAQSRPIDEIIEEHVNAPERSTHRRWREHNLSANYPINEAAGVELVDFIQSGNNVHSLIKVSPTKQVCPDQLCPGLDSALAEREESERILVALSRSIGKLPPDQQQLLQELMFENIPAKDIAERDQVSQAAISRRKARLLKTLRRFLAAEGVKSLPDHRLSSEGINDTTWEGEPQ